MDFFIAYKKRITNAYNNFIMGYGVHFFLIYKQFHLDTLQHKQTKGEIFLKENFSVDLECLC